MKHIEERKRKIAAFLSSESYVPMTLDELQVVLDVPTNDRNAFKELMEQMKRVGVISISAKGRYTIPEDTKLVKGKIQGTAGRFFFLIPENNNLDDIFIAADKMNGAMHGDSVLVKSVAQKGGDRKTRGEVVQILNDKRDEILGIVEKSDGLYLFPFDKRVGKILIDPDGSEPVLEGDVAAIDITCASHGYSPAEGVITEVVAHGSDPRAFYKYLLRAFDYEIEYPEEAVDEAKFIAKTAEKTSKNRKDLTHLFTVTIDGADAKDLDDAISIKKEDDGTYTLWVHIADVSYFVREGSELDNEAADRGTSVYLVDRVIPMLPEVISNGLCSLNPDEDKFAFTVKMSVGLDGNVTRSEIFESLIRSNQRMTYSNVHKLLSGEEPELLEQYGKILPVFKTMHELSLVLRKKRRDRGSIDFDFKESKVIMNENGRPEAITKYDITDANRIIEEFMILCNETVAEEFGWIGFPFIFRVHGNPEQGKINDLNKFLKTMGLGLKSPGNLHPAAIQKAIFDAKGKPYEHLVNTVVLRSLQKAEYSTVNQGHFGLASESYSHFTSPIRRYPDLMIHRLIKKKIKSEAEGQSFTERELKILEAHASSIAKSSSELERKAERAERQLVDYYKALFMEKHVGEVFSGVISGVAGFGMFVELDNTVEGLVRVENLDGYYIFDKENYRLYMKNGPGRFTIGMPVSVRIMSVNANRGEVDMVLDSKKKSSSNPKRRKEVYRPTKRKYSGKKKH